MSGIGTGYIRDIAHPAITNVTSPEYVNLANTANAANHYNRHARSTILSYWFYLLAHGDDDCLLITGIGIEKAARLVYTTQTAFATSADVTYTQFAEKTMLCVLDILNSPSPWLTPSEAARVKKAWQLVGITSLPVYGFEIHGSEISEHDNITIHAGETRTINNIHRFAPGTGIIIMPGGKLIVDGGTLTNNSCLGGFWNGVYVVGNANLPQYPVTNQGYLELKNGATIENALTAVTNYNIILPAGLYNPNYDTTEVYYYNPNSGTLSAHIAAAVASMATAGGRISATNAHFYNNKQALRFYPAHTSSLTNGLSFTNCDFVINDDYLNTSNSTPMAYIFGVNNATFTGCRFLNENSHSDHLDGIVGFDAKITLASRPYDPNLMLCYGCRDLSPGDSCLFKGFNVALSLSNSGANLSSTQLKVHRARFLNNRIGIYVSGIPN